MPRSCPLWSPSGSRWPSAATKNEESGVEGWIEIDDQRGVVTQAWANPCLARTDAHRTQEAQTVVGHERVLDVKCRAVSRSGSPIEGWVTLCTVLQTVESVVRADQAELRACRQGIDVIAGLARFVPALMVVEVAGDD